MDKIDMLVLGETVKVPIVDKIYEETRIVATPLCVFRLSTTINTKWKCRKKEQEKKESKTFFS